MTLEILECSLDAMTPENRNQILAQLSSDETPLICYEIGSKEGGSAYVITQRQVIAAHSNSKFKEELVSWILLTDITSISYNPILSNITISGYAQSAITCGFGKDPLIPMSKFRSILQDGIKRARESQRVPADRLRELVQLHQDGFITDAEFDQKRKDTLEKL